MQRNPFINAGNRKPSVVDKKKVPSSGQHSTSGSSKFPSQGGGSYQTGAVSISSGVSSGGSRFPSGQSLAAAVSQFVGPMGICPASYVCVHWQLCRNSVVISDGTGIIDKSKRRPLGQVRDYCTRMLI